MCGCVEKMPQVSRADCTQVDVDEEWFVSFRADDVFRVRRVSIDLDFVSCKGNPRNNLRSYFQRSNIGGDDADKIDPYVTGSCYNAPTPQPTGA